MTIEEFIEARLAEDERIARAAATSGDRWEDRLSEEYPGEYRAYVARVGDDDFANMHDRDAARHIARHDPAHVLRQCATLRLALAFWRGLTRLRTIAAIWSDHEDYQQDWAI